MCIRDRDNVVLNLTPFEVRYDENRQFFLSGFEMFNKSGLFYSRRVGRKPGLFDSMNDSANKAGGKVLSNPMDSRLINAFKINGRTSNGVGIGVFLSLIHISPISGRILRTSRIISIQI